MKSPDLELLEKNLGVKFKKSDFLLQALTHRSYLNENPSWPLPHNERLEFLGDAVLELAVTEYLYQNYPNPEGELTSFRASLVNDQSLSQVATELAVDQFLLLSRGEMKEFGRSRQEILGNTFEAIVGAIYLDQGYEAAKKFLEVKLFPRLEEILKLALWRDPKSHFQEEAQAKVNITPTYRVLSEWGPDHAKEFLVGVYLGEEKVAEGEGLSKQEAEVEAAKHALEVKGWQ
ncbi:MAG: ribonuclease III [Parcubacteria group bacterium]|nr:ribonuclease III [Parcubacteria group bacterium]